MTTRTHVPIPYPYMRSVAQQTECGWLTRHGCGCPCAGTVTTTALPSASTRTGRSPTQHSQEASRSSSRSPTRPPASPAPRSSREPSGRCRPLPTSAWTLSRAVTCTSECSSGRLGLATALKVDRRCGQISFRPSQRERLHQRPDLRGVVRGRVLRRAGRDWQQEHYRIL